MLMYFILLSSHRTKLNADLQNKIADTMTKKILQYEAELKDNLDKINVKWNNAAQVALKSVLGLTSAVLDLEYKLIENTSDIPFVTSDNPVVKYNQFLEKRNHPGGITGYASKGFQTFYPLSPKYCLILFDKDVYRIGEKKKKVLPLSSKESITEINKLQFLNCDENIFSNGVLKQSYFEKIFNKTKKFKKSNIESVTEHSLIDSNEKLQNGKLIRLSTSDLRIKLSLPIIKETKKAKRYTMGDKAVHLRKRFY